MRPELLFTRALRRAALSVRTRWTPLLLIVAALVAVPAPAAAQTTTQVVEYYTTDAIGSVRAVTKQVNGTWQVVARHDFMPFGEEVAPPIPPQDKRLFTGKERDCETGQDYFEARNYRADLGRFTTVDPLGVTSDRMLDPAQLNRFDYARGNPLRFIDPLGLYVWAASGCAQGDRGCEKAYAENQKKFRQGLEALERARNSLPVDSPDRARVDAALTAYGDEGVENGVTVAFGGLGPNVAANLDPDGHGHFTVTFDPAKNGSRNEWAINAGHEGTHIANYGLPVDRLRQLTPFSDEYRAYFVSSLVAQRLGERSLTYASGFTIWSSSWRSADRDAMRAAGIALHVRQAYGHLIPPGPWDPIR